jgi:hypothetical protein
LRAAANSFLMARTRSGYRALVEEFETLKQAASILKEAS